MGMLKLGKNCSVCKEWQEHCYWSHMADDNKHFLKHMVGDFTGSMMVPARFANNFNGHIYEKVNLKFPSGKTWSIGLANSGTGDVVLQSGWKEFVDANSIQEGDCLLFRYSGVSFFDVLIFDSSGCEKASLHFDENHWHGRTEKSAGAEGGGHVDIDHHHHLEMTLHRNSGRSIPRACKRDLFSDEIEQDQCEAKENDGEDEDEDLVAAAEDGYYFSKNGSVIEYHLTEEDKAEISSVRVPVEPGNPVFVQVIHPSHVRRNRYGIVGVSPEFAAKYLGAVENEVVLERASRRGEWHVQFVRRENTRGFTGTGWRQFARDNNLIGQDVCLFELMVMNEAGDRRCNRRRPTMAVHVLRQVSGRFVLLR